jgi:hypothetical protein
MLRGWGGVLQTVNQNSSLECQKGFELSNILFNYIDAISLNNDGSRDIQDVGLELHSKKFALVFFAALLDYENVQDETNLTEEDFISLVTDPREKTRKQLIKEGEGNASDKPKTIRRVQVNRGLSILSEIISAIPSDEELAKPIIDSIGINEVDLNMKKLKKIDPSLIVASQKSLINSLIQTNNLGSVRHVVGLVNENTYTPVLRYIFI